MKQLPVFYRIGGLCVRGHGFAALVAVRGRAVAERLDDGGFRIAPVDAPGLDEEAEGLYEAFERLRERLQAALFAAAADARGFDEFAARAGALFAQPDLGLARRWSEAVSTLGGSPDAGPEWGGGAGRPSPLEVARVDGPAGGGGPGANQVDALVVLDRRSWRAPERAPRLERRAAP